jgi:hypothetical protein
MMRICSRLLLSFTHLANPEVFIAVVGLPINAATLAVCPTSVYGCVVWFQISSYGEAGRSAVDKGKPQTRCK